MSLIHKYADAYGIDREEVVAWVKSYISRPGDFPRMIEAGVIERTPDERKASIQAYIRSQLEMTTTWAIKREIFEERSAIYEFEAGIPREEAEKRARQEVFGE